MVARRLAVSLLAIAAGFAPSASGSTRGEARATVSVSGDLLIHDSVLARALALGGGERYEFEPLLAGIRPWVEGADLALCHVETPITAHAPPAGWTPFSTPPALVRAIAQTGWDACSIASNHSLDQRRGGIVSTGRALDRVGVGHTGAFTSASARRRPLILDANGLQVALLSYTTATNNHALPAPWSVNVVGDPAAIVADARRARRAGADAVIANIHWTSRADLWTPALRMPGEPDYTAEYEFAPGAGQVELVTALLGAAEITAVIAQGPHVVQPIVRVNGKYAIFSEGNVISGANAKSAMHPEGDDGLIALLTLVSEGGGARVERVDYVPVVVVRPANVVVPANQATASYARTVSVAGRGKGFGPLTARSQPRR